MGCAAFKDTVDERKGHGAQRHTDGAAGAANGVCVVPGGDLVVPATPVRTAIRDGGCGNPWNGAECHESAERLVSPQPPLTAPVKPPAEPEKDSAGAPGVELPDPPKAEGAEAAPPSTNGTHVGASARRRRMSVRETGGARTAPATLVQRRLSGKDEEAVAPAPGPEMATEPDSGERDRDATAPPAPEVDVGSVEADVSISSERNGTPAAGEEEAKAEPTSAKMGNALSALVDAHQVAESVGPDGDGLAGPPPHAAGVDGNDERHGEGSGGSAEDLVPPSAALPGNRRHNVRSLLHDNEHLISLLSPDATELLKLEEVRLEEGSSAAGAESRPNGEPQPPLDGGPGKVQENGDHAETPTASSPSRPSSSRPLGEKGVKRVSFVAHPSPTSGAHNMTGSILCTQTLVKSSSGKWSYMGRRPESARSLRSSTMLDRDDFLPSIGKSPRRHRSDEEGAQAVDGVVAGSPKRKLKRAKSLPKMPLDPSMTDAVPTPRPRKSTKTTKRSKRRDHGDLTFSELHRMENSDASNGVAPPGEDTLPWLQGDPECSASALSLTASLLGAVPLGDHSVEGSFSVRNPGQELAATPGTNDHPPVSPNRVPSLPPTSSPRSRGRRADQSHSLSEGTTTEAAAEQRAPTWPTNGDGLPSTPSKTHPGQHASASKPDDGRSLPSAGRPRDPPAGNGGQFLESTRGGSTPASNHHSRLPQIAKDYLDGSSSSQNGRGGANTTSRPSYPLAATPVPQDDGSSQPTSRFCSGAAHDTDRDSTSPANTAFSSFFMVIDPDEATTDG